MAQRAGHIMISYQWDYQPEVRKICEALKRFRFNVWMDLDKMSGDIYKKMAEGVEGAEIIIICMSTKYQNSENCNKEFEYAQVRKKTIIPIKMEKDFNAAGSLGLITAGKLYIDFSNMSKFDENIKSLKKEIESHMDQSVVAKQNTSNASSSGSWQKVNSLADIDHFLVDDNEYNRPGCLALKTSRKRWLCAESDNQTIKANRGSIGPWEKFELSSSKPGYFSIKAWTGRYLSAAANGKVTISSSNIGQNETWSIFTRNHAIALKSSHGKYLSAQPNGMLEAAQSTISNYEQFYPYEESDSKWKM